RGGVDARPAGHLAAALLKAPCVRSGAERVGLGGADAYHQPAAPARRDRHMTADEEREAAEHLLLRDALLAGDELADPRCQLLVVRHRYATPIRIIAPGRSQRSV